MAHPTPKAIPDGTVNIDANAQVTVNGGTGPIRIANGQTSTILFTYQGAAAECELKIKFHQWKTSQVRNGGMVVVGS
ncbi:MAG TPA: hypothetical protein VHM88_25575 [Candidatus Acidoferrales bacterium]|jgi:hypothetical protein|nr:hypothetical protein [Candidatus Acidoferrales bacterium]